MTQETRSTSHWSKRGPYPRPRETHLGSISEHPRNPAHTLGQIPTPSSCEPQSRRWCVQLDLATRGHRGKAATALVGKRPTGHEETADRELLPDKALLSLLWLSPHSPAAILGLPQPGPLCVESWWVQVSRCVPTGSSPFVRLPGIDMLSLWSLDRPSGLWKALESSQHRISH